MHDQVSMAHAAYVRARIARDRLVLEIASGHAPIETRSCALAEARRALGSGPLDGPRLEQAIACTEDAVMPLLAELPSEAHLQLAGDAMASLRALLPDPAHDHAPIETVEHLFQQLADRALGSVTAWRHGTDSETFAFALVVLRELMHHGGFDACTWPDTDSGT